METRCGPTLPSAALIQAWGANGRPARDIAGGHVTAAVEAFRYYAGIVRDTHGQTIPTPGGESLVYTTREPLGVVAALIPWNSPIIGFAQKVAPAIAAGNTIVLKPSELASPTAVEITRAVQEVLPPGVVNIVTGLGHRAGSRLVQNRGVAKISFTGGTETGRKLMTAAGQRLTPSLMELGGKSAFVICDDADLETAVADAALGIFRGSGEVCFAASRLLIHDALYDDFVAALAATAGSIRIGDALDPATQFGPLISADHRQRVLEHVDRAIDQGARLAHGGRACAPPGLLSDGYFMEPTILCDPEGRTETIQREVFGPVAIVERWTDEDEAIARANATDYGLAAGVWTRSLERAHRIATSLHAGIIWVNTWFETPAGAPMGGIKASGFGRESSAETLLEYSAPKTVNISLSSVRPSIWG